METLMIEASEQTPEIHFDGNNGLFRIKGKSYPENVNAFYEPVIKYINDYKENPAANTKLEFNWLYYNTATSKMIMRMIIFLKEADTELEIGWYYNEGFEMIMEKGQEIEEILGVGIDIKQI